VELKDLFAYGPTIVITALLLFKWLPVWKEVRLREMDLRHEELGALGKLGDGLSSLATVLNSVAIEQRRATETIELMQRVNADATERLEDNIKMVGERLDELERHNETTRTGTGAH
jgi:hypothetical protein